MKYIIFLQKIVLLCLSLLVTGSFSACNILPEEEGSLAPPLVKPAAVEYQLFKAERKSIIKFVKGIGYLRPEADENLFFTESGKRLKSIDVKNGEFVKKGTIMVRTDSGNVQSRIRAQEIRVKKAELMLAKGKKDYEGYLSLPLEQRPSQMDMEELQLRNNIMELDLELEMLALNDLNTEYNNSVLKATLDGRVIFIENLAVGDFVDAYKTIVTLADPSSLHIYFQSQDASLVKTGMKAEIRYKDKKYDADVVLSPDDVPSDAYEKLKGVVILKANGLPDSIKMGDSVDISIPVESRENTIVIPKAGLHKILGSTSVRTIEGVSKKEFDVEVGIETDTEVEIISGLEEGEMVILN